MSGDKIVLRAVFIKARKLGATFAPVTHGELTEWQQRVTGLVEQHGGNVVAKQSVASKPLSFFEVDFEISAAALDKVRDTLSGAVINNKHREQLLPFYELRTGVPRTPKA